ncbi:MAG: ATP synthase F1 subunit delta [Flavobacteriales bacterium]|nr:ATP synthase F1 subunit delta [Flavobacteriales bacterium]
MRGIKISSRYAKSLLYLCIEKKQVDAVFEDMKLVQSTVRASREFAVLLSSPVVKADTKVTILKKIFGGKVNEITQHFMNLLTAKGREGLLGEVADSFVEQVMMHKHIASAHITTAVAMDAETRAKISAIAKKLAGGEIDLEEKTSADLIGGFVLKVGDNMIDASVSGKIRRLKREFDENLYVPDF